VESSDHAAQVIICKIIVQTSKIGGDSALRRAGQGKRLVEMSLIGVSKITGKPEPEPENRETGKPRTRFRFRFEKFKNRVPRFRYLVFSTRFLPGNREPGYPYYLIIFIFY
jgi:hypothetical protein